VVIPSNHQVTIIISPTTGLRGAVAFALAIKNTESLPRQLMLTSVLIIAIVTVIFNGGLTTQALLKLGIRCVSTLLSDDLFLFGRSLPILLS